MSGTLVEKVEQYRQTMAGERPEIMDMPQDQVVSIMLADKNLNPTVKKALTSIYADYTQRLKANSGLMIHAPKVSIFPTPEEQQQEWFYSLRTGKANIVRPMMMFNMDEVEDAPLFGEKDTFVSVRDKKTVINQRAKDIEQAEELFSKELKSEGWSGDIADVLKEASNGLGLYHLWGEKESTIFDTPRKRHITADGLREEFKQAKVASKRLSFAAKNKEERIKELQEEHESIVKAISDAEKRLEEASKIKTGNRPYVISRIQDEISLLNQRKLGIEKWLKDEEHKTAATRNKEFREEFKRTYGVEYSETAVDNFNKKRKAFIKAETTYLEKQNFEEQFADLLNGNANAISLYKWEKKVASILQNGREELQKLYQKEGVDDDTIRQRHQAGNPMSRKEMMEIRLKVLQGYVKDLKIKIDKQYQEDLKRTGTDNIETARQEYENAHRRAFGHNELETKIQRYSDSQEVCSGVVKGLTIAAATIAVTAATCGTGTGAVAAITGSAAAAAGTTLTAEATDQFDAGVKKSVKKYGVETFSNAASDQIQEEGLGSFLKDATIEGLENIKWKEDGKAALEAGVITLIMGGVGYKVTQITKGLGASTATTALISGTAEVGAGLGTEYKMHGELTKEGITYIIAFTAGGKILSMIPKRGAASEISSSLTQEGAARGAMNLTSEAAPPAKTVGNTAHASETSAQPKPAAGKNINTDASGRTILTDANGNKITVEPRPTEPTSKAKQRGTKTSSQTTEETAWENFGKESSARESQAHIRAAEETTARLQKDLEIARQAEAKANAEAAKQKGLAEQADTRAKQAKTEMEKAKAALEASEARTKQAEQEQIAAEQKSKQLEAERQSLKEQLKAEQERAQTAESRTEAEIKASQEKIGRLEERLKAIEGENGELIQAKRALEQKVKTFEETKAKLTEANSKLAAERKAAIDRANASDAEAAKYKRQAEAAKRQADAAEKNATQHKERAETLERELNDTKTQSKTELEKAKLREQAADARAKQAEQERIAAEQKAKQLEAESNQIKEQLKAETERANTAENRTETEIKASQEKIGQLENRLKSIEGENGELAQANKALQQKVKTFKEANAKLTETNKKLAAERDAALKRAGDAEAAAHRLESEVKSANEKATAAERSAAEHKAKAESLERELNDTKTSAKSDIEKAKLREKAADARAKQAEQEQIAAEERAKQIEAERKSLNEQLKAETERANTAESRTDAEIKASQEKIENLQKRLRQIEGENGELARAKNEATARAKTAEEANAKLTEANKNLTAERDAALKRAKRAESEAAKLEEQAEKAGKRAEAAEESAMKLRIENKKAKLEAKNAKDEAGRLAAESKAKTAKIEELIETKKAYEARIEELEARQKALNERIRAAEERAQASERSAENTNNNALKLQKQLDDITRQLAETRATLDSKVSSLENANSALKRTNEELVKRNEELSGSLESTRQENTILRGEVEAARRAQADATADATANKNRIEQAEAGKNEALRTAEQAQRERAAAEQRGQKLIEENQRLREEIQRLQSERGLKQSLVKPGTPDSFDKSTVKPAKEVKNYDKARKALHDTDGNISQLSPEDKALIEEYNVLKKRNQTFNSNNKELFDGMWDDPFSFWKHRSNAPTVKTAWKMHLYSTSQADYELLAKEVIPYLKSKGVSFKTVKSTNSIEGLNGGKQQGKAFTIYPESNAQMAQIAKELDALIKQKGLTIRDAHIAGDRPMGDSGRLHYRYEYKSGKDAQRILDTRIEEQSKLYEELYERNRGGDNYLARDMKPTDDIWLNFNPADPNSMPASTSVKATAAKTVIEDNPAKPTVTPADEPALITGAEPLKVEITFKGKTPAEPAAVSTDAAPIIGEIQPKVNPFKPAKTPIAPETTGSKQPKAPEPVKTPAKPAEPINAHISAEKPAKPAKAKASKTRQSKPAVKDEPAPEKPLRAKKNPIETARKSVADKEAALKTNPESTQLQRKLRQAQRRLKLALEKDLNAKETQIRDLETKKSLSHEEMETLSKLSGEANNLRHEISSLENAINIQSKNPTKSAKTTGEATPEDIKPAADSPAKPAKAETTQSKRVRNQRKAMLKTDKERIAAKQEVERLKSQLEKEPHNLDVKAKLGEAQKAYKKAIDKKIKKAEAQIKQLKKLKKLTPEEQARITSLENEVAQLKTELGNLGEPIKVTPADHIAKANADIETARNKVNELKAKVKAEPNNTEAKKSLAEAQKDFMAKIDESIKIKGKELKKLQGKKSQTAEEKALAEKLSKEIDSSRNERLHLAEEKISELQKAVDTNPKDKTARKALSKAKQELKALCKNDIKYYKSQKAKLEKIKPESRTIQETQQINELNNRIQNRRTKLNGKGSAKSETQSAKPGSLTKKVVAAAATAAIGYGAVQSFKGTKAEADESTVSATDDTDTTPAPSEPKDNDDWLSFDDTEENNAKDDDDISFNDDDDSLSFSDRMRGYTGSSLERLEDMMNSIDFSRLSPTTQANMSQYSEFMQMLMQMYMQMQYQNVAMQGYMLQCFMNWQMGMTYAMIEYNNMLFANI